MPNGFGFNWPGHSTDRRTACWPGSRSDRAAAGLFDATEAAVGKLALAGGVKLASGAIVARGVGRAGRGGRHRGAASGAAAQDRGGAGDRRAGSGSDRRRRVRGPWALPARGWPRPRFVEAVCGCGCGDRPVGDSGRCRAAGRAGRGRASSWCGRIRRLSRRRTRWRRIPYLDPGTPVSGVAPDFTLSDQFGQPVSLHSFRGKVVILAFNDSECTTVCPLTTTAMLDAKAMLGKAGSQVQLLGVDANPAAISLEDVWSYSELHGMLHAWRFLTGSLPQLKQVWKEYGVEAAIEAGEITHTPALFVIDPAGPAVAGVHHPDVLHRGRRNSASCSPRAPRLCFPAIRRCTRISPTRGSADHAERAGDSARAREAEPSSVGPGKSARLFVFFATWDQETSGLAGQLDALNRYQTIAARSGLPQLTAVDEASVEPGQGDADQLPRSASRIRSRIPSRSIAAARSPTGTRFSACHGSSSPRPPVSFSTTAKSQPRAGPAPTSSSATSKRRSPALPDPPAPPRQARARRLAATARRAAPAGRPTPG